MEIVRYEKNEKGRDFVCSDLHGEKRKFYDALERVRFDEKVDRVFSAGDLIDRGRDSYGCARLLNKPWFKSTAGNHEDMLKLGHTTPYGQRAHANHGGEWFYAMPKAKRQEIYDLVNALPYAFEIDTDAGLVGVLHADVVVAWSLIRAALDGTMPDQNSSCKMSIVWANSRFKTKLADPCEGIHHVYVGHIPMRDMLTLGNVTYIDGGACYSDSRVVNLVRIQ